MGSEGEAEKILRLGHGPRQRGVSERRLGLGDGGLVQWYGVDHLADQSFSFFSLRSVRAALRLCLKPPNPFDMPGQCCLRPMNLPQLDYVFGGQQTKLLRPQ